MQTGGVVPYHGEPHPLAHIWLAGYSSRMLTPSPLMGSGVVWRRRVIMVAVRAPTPTTASATLAQMSTLVVVPVAANASLTWSTGVLVVTCTR